MKWLLISCILIIFSICCLHAIDSASYGNVVLISGDCMEQIQNQSRLVQSCISQIFNATEFTEEMNTTFLQYSGDSEAVQAFAVKYCPILPQLPQCELIGDVDEECRFTKERTLNKQSRDIANELLDYVCGNNGTAQLLRILENNGLETIYENKNFQECFEIMGSSPKVDEKTDGPTAELCDNIDRSFQCYADYVKNHENQNLVTISKEVNAIFRHAVKCTTLNAL